MHIKLLVGKILKPTFLGASKSLISNGFISIRYKYLELFKCGQTNEFRPLLKYYVDDYLLENYLYIN